MWNWCVACSLLVVVHRRGRLTASSPCSKRREHLLRLVSHTRTFTLIPRLCPIMSGALLVLRRWQPCSATLTRCAASFCEYAGKFGSNKNFPLIPSHTLLDRYYFLLRLLPHRELALRWMGCCVSHDAAAEPAKRNHSEQEVVSATS
jgi:hypothetical protein